MKIFESLRMHQGERVVPETRFAEITTIKETDEIGPTAHDNHFIWTLGVNISSSMSGPIEAAGEIEKRAIGSISNEIFGDAVTGLRELQSILYREAYRPSDDPALLKIDAIIKEMQGQ